MYPFDTHALLTTDFYQLVGISLRVGASCGKSLDRDPDCMPLGATQLVSRGPKDVQGVRLRRGSCVVYPLWSSTTYRAPTCKCEIEVTDTHEPYGFEAMSVN